MDGMLKAQVSLEPDVITTKWYCTLPRKPELDAHHQMRYGAIPQDILYSVMGLTSPQCILSVYSKYH